MIEVAAALLGILQPWTDFILILARLVFNAIVGFWQKHQAANAVQTISVN